MANIKAAVIGAGPAGIYISHILSTEVFPGQIDIDLFDALPTPYGLVRYGVAPDHPRIKSVVDTLAEMLETVEQGAPNTSTAAQNTKPHAKNGVTSLHECTSPASNAPAGRIRFFGAVQYGREIDMQDLKKHYNFAVFATGASCSAPFGAIGADAIGVYAASDFVHWYDAHPYAPREWDLGHSSVAVVGNGNVALDISRMLARSALDLAKTEMPHHLVEHFAKSSVRDIHIIGRRGPMDVKFTPLELRELGEVPGVEMIFDERDFTVQSADPSSNTDSKQKIVIKRIFDSWRARSGNTCQDSAQKQQMQDADSANTDGTDTDGAEPAKRIFWHFFTTVTRIIKKENCVHAIECTRTAPQGADLSASSATVPSPETSIINVGQVYTATGYFGTKLPDVPFDPKLGIIPNRAGVVVDEVGKPIPALYTTGWIKRGPVGLIGSTKSDAKETAASIKDTQDLWWNKDASLREGLPDIAHTLRDRSIQHVNIGGWHAIHAAELALGTNSKPRVKIFDLSEMMSIASKGKTAT